MLPCVSNRVEMVNGKFVHKNGERKRKQRISPEEKRPLIAEKEVRSTHTCIKTGEFAVIMLLYDSHLLFSVLVVKISNTWILLSTSRRHKCTSRFTQHKQRSNINRVKFDYVDSEFL